MHTVYQIMNLVVVDVNAYQDSVEMVYNVQVGTTMNFNIKVNFSDLGTLMGQGRVNFLLKIILAP